MIVERGTDYILYLNLKDDDGAAMRVAECATFSIRVFTNDKKKYLLFDKNNVVNKGDYDCICISADQLEGLPSGVISYTYYYSINDSNFADDKQYNRNKTVYTEDYFMNDFLNTAPSNPVTLEAIKRVENLITDETNRATSVENQLSERIDEINNGSSIGGIDNSAIIEEEERATAAEQELDNKISAVSSELATEVTRATDAEQTLTTNLNSEISRAKGAEGTLTTNLNKEVTRATNKENELSTSISSETTRATNAENSLKERIDSITMRVENGTLYLSL